MIVGAGFLLAMRIGPGGSYWTTVLPAILVMSVGMAGVAAPLTTAVLASVDARHTGSASGLNSAVARTGGLIATALLGAVLAAKGAGLTADFRAALLAGAIAGLGGGGVRIGAHPRRTRAAVDSRRNSPSVSSVPHQCALKSALISPGRRPSDWVQSKKLIPLGSASVR